MVYVKPERMHFCIGGSAGQQLSWLHNFMDHGKIEWCHISIFQVRARAPKLIITYKQLFRWKYLYVVF